MEDHVKARRFVVQLHAARTLHYDFRLERQGVLKSWAVPKGLAEEAGVNRLAIEVEDHALAFGDFEGQIPQGQYGAGQISIYDKGEYDSLFWSENLIEVYLHGQRYLGRFRIKRFPRRGAKYWLIDRVGNQRLRQE